MNPIPSPQRLVAAASSLAHSSVTAAATYLDPRRTFSLVDRVVTQGRLVARAQVRRVVARPAARREPAGIGTNKVRRYPSSASRDLV